MFIKYGCFDHFGSNLGTKVVFFFHMCKKKMQFYDILLIFCAYNARKSIRGVNR